ncbi:DUF6531 domain-containing protein [Arthrobacter zhaoxinii]|uniref:DUF6531 domain-containing protein n=1 Tax=Arthrobacter zhaoxinii TaxID=2964616 RepID=A0ABY5YQU4_9MICC|nr:DUF6531 domain-containing protein [Arthrobacter zhaoxinii]UWX97481.1 DUF6531 domain-containing protein [Arthrobacter zhaoxinii]
MAHEEDDRRRKANDWLRDYKSRTPIEKWWDDLWDLDIPDMNPGPRPTFTEYAPVVTPREIPQEGDGGVTGGGTSSARPDALRSFADSSRALDADLVFSAEILRGNLSQFESNCSWATLHADGLVTAFKDYLSANENDVQWAIRLADAFAAAGGESAVSTVSDAALSAALASAGVAENRQDLSFVPPRASGAAPTTGFANDPVNTATGNFIEPETDLALAGAASGLVLSRMYNSLPSGLETPGVFGPGWASILDQHLIISDEGCRWVMADGRAVDFPREGAAWARAIGESYWLTSEVGTAAGFSDLEVLPEGAGEILVVRDNQGAWWAYSQAGVWLGAGSGPGQTVSVAREDTANGAGTGPVARISHARGRFLEVDYVDGLVALVRSSDGRRVEYGYDDGRLASVSTGTGTRRYRWNDQGLIDAVYDEAGVLEAENTYDEQGRVIRQVTQHGRRIRFAYLPGRVTVVSDEDGTKSNSWIADRKGRLVGVLDSHDQRQSLAYDGHGNLVSSTERDGSVTVHAYDERGRRIRTVTPEGADLTYGWDGQDRITTVVTESGSVVTYEYADGISRNPSAIVDPLGGRTEMEWQDGLLICVTDPTGVTVTFDYDSFGDLAAAGNAVGDTAKILRDQAGRPIAAISPSGAVTRFVYNAAGLLVRREDPDGAVWSFEHDSAGRTTASVAPDGGRTELEYATNGELVLTVDPLGRSVERVFDELGNITAAILPDGARWGFTHDSLSRLVGITDPAGHDWVREYDKIGNLTAVVDPTGVRTEAITDRKAGTATLADAFASTTYSFDEYGRPIRFEDADGSAELVTYDAAGRPAELVDGEGGLTVLGRDLAGKITSVTSPSGAVTRYEYDICGRPWKTIDPMGAVTELVYDVDQRVVARTSPTGEVETFEYDACGRLLLARTPGNGAARYGYDKAGRLSFSQDSWYGTRRFKYNLAGEMVESINGVGGRTQFEYDIRGRLVRITDPVGKVITRTYSETDQIEAVTDPLGRVSTATYDPAGRQLSASDSDGNTTTWTYDRAGRKATTSRNGKLIASVDRDVRSRRVVVTDYTGSDGLAVEHDLGFNRRGQLTSRTRGGRGLSWEYDSDGNRTGFTDANGTTTTYTRDAAGRVRAVNSPRLGEAVFTHDAAGRLTAVTAGDLVQEWVYRDGYLSEHTRTDRSAQGAADTTLVGRDEDGRIIGLTRAGAVTRYTYDGAGQLSTAATTRQGERAAAVSEWEYDVGGRLVRETTQAGARTYTYDDAGQLLAITEPDGTRTQYVHDCIGRRIRMTRPDGSWNEYAWGPTGALQATVERTSDGTVASAHHFWVDALGELAAVDDAVVWWDTAQPVPALACIGAEQVLSLPGGVAGIGDAWTASGWRAARPTDETDPWAVLGASTIPNPAPGGIAGTVSGVGAAGLAGVLPAGVGLIPGGLNIAGLEWLGERAYDPAARGFLSVDPLAPVLGAGWDGNPYAYAGNNPLNAVDPTGLTPLTDADLKAIEAANQGGLASAWEWVADNWEYLLGGYLFLIGLVLSFTGVGTGAGVAIMALSGALMAGGGSLWLAKREDGTVSADDWIGVGVDALIGMATGGLGGLASLALGRLAPAAGAVGITTAQKILRSSTVRGALSAGTEGATENTLNYHFDHGDGKTVTGYLQAAGVGFATSAGSSVLSNKGSDYVNSKITITPVHPQGADTSRLAPNVARKNVIVEETVDRTVGAGGSAVNEWLQPKGSEDQFDSTDVWESGIDGILGGASGNTVGPRRAHGPVPAP